jgi:hypothetical protein
MACAKARNKAKPCCPPSTVVLYKVSHVVLFLNPPLPPVQHSYASNVIHSCTVRRCPKTLMLVVVVVVVGVARRLELPVLVYRLDGPIELLAQRLGEELLDGNVKLL